jgi:hypothetical protein
MLALGFLPVLVVAGWVLVAMQPHATASATHVRTWSGDMGILDVVRAVGTWIGVLAFGIGATLAAVVEPFGRTLAEPDAVAADEPTMAERRAVPAEDRETVIR